MLQRSYINRGKIQFLTAVFHNVTVNSARAGSALVSAFIVLEDSTRRDCMNQGALRVQERSRAWSVIDCMVFMRAGVLELAAASGNAVAPVSIQTRKFPGKGLKVARSLDSVSKLQLLVCLGSVLIQCMEPLKQQTLLENW